MRFQVPQFIEVEDKIIGPLTIKQFLYLVGGAGLSFILYTVIGNLLVSAIFIIPVLAFSVALAFYKFNNKPFIFLIESAFYYFVKEKLYIWKKKEKPVEQKEFDPATLSSLSDFYVPKLSDSKLKDLTWSLDIKESTNPAQNNQGKKTF